MEFASAESIELAVKNMKIFGLGAYGTGKSTFAATAPTPGFVYDFDQRISTYRGRAWDYVTFPMTAKGWVEFETTHKEVKKRALNGEYKTIVLDSSTSLTDTAMERALQIDPKRSPEGGPIWNVHYQIVKNLVEPKLHDILSFPCNVIVLGHWKIETDAKTGNIISIDPLLTGQLSAKVPGYFDEVYAFFSRTKEGKEQFFFRTVSLNYFKARSTISGPMRLLPDEISNSWPALMKYVDLAVVKEKELREKKEAK